MKEIFVKKSLMLQLIFAILSLLLFSLLEGWVQVLVFIFIIMYFLYHNKYQFSHPLNWYLMFFLLYSIYFPIQQLLISNYDVNTKKVLFLHFVSLVAALSVFFNTDEILCRKLKRVSTPKSATWLVQLMVIILMLLGVVGFYHIFGSGVSSKAEITEARADGGGIVFLYSLILMPMYIVIYEFIRLDSNKKYSGIGLIALSSIMLLFIAYLISGERDLLFRLLVILGVFIFDVKKKYKSNYSTIAIIFIMMVAPVTQALKGALIGDFSISQYNAYELFNQEFVSASRNLYYLIKFQDEYFYGLTYWWDLKRFLNIPGSFSTGQWFHEIFRVNNEFSGSAGWGFTLIGEAFINFGVFGVFVFSFLSAKLIAFSYRLRVTNEYFYGFYCYLVVAFIYTQRADLANLMAMLIKIPLLGSLPLIFAMFILRELKRS